MSKYVSSRSSKIKQKLGFEVDNEIRGLEKVFEASHDAERSTPIKKSFNNFIDNESNNEEPSNQKETNKVFSSKLRTLRVDEMYPVMIWNQCEISKDQAIQNLVISYWQNEQFIIHENVYNAIKLWDNFVFLIFEFELYKTNNKIALIIFSQFRDFVIRYKELQQK